MLDALQRSIDNHNCSIIKVEGAPGCGKTAFLEAVIEGSAARGATVLSVACSEGEQDLDFVVVRHLLQNCGQLAQVERAAQRIEENTLVAMSSESSTVTRALAIPIHDDTLTMLQAVAERGPLVIVLDDVQYMDPSSAKCLLYAIRRLRNLPVVLVASESCPAGRLAPFPHDFILQTDHRDIVLDPLSVQGIAEMVRCRTASAGIPADADVLAAARDYHALTGGNPLLVNVRLSSATAHRFERSVFRLLERAPAPVLDVACGLAVLGTEYTPEILARLLGLEAGEVERCVSALTRAGLVVDGAYRHPAMQTAVLTEMDPTHRAELHRRTAQLLLDVGAAARLLAEHLLTAQGKCPDWGVQVLHNVALRASAEGDTAFAESCLELASTDERQYGHTKAMLLELSWRRDPTAADEHVPGLFGAFARGQLTVNDAVILIRHLLWHGRVVEAEQVITKLDRAADFQQAAGPVNDLTVWLAHAYPPMAAMVPAPAQPAADLTGTDPYSTATTVLSAVLTNQPDNQVIPSAQHILRSRDSYELTFISSQAALLTLIFTDQLDEAARRCDQLIADSRHLKAPTWQAVLTGIKAEICRRTGSPEQAVELAESALTLISEQSWGVPIGQPLSSLLLSYTTLGRRAEAARLMDRVIPPAIMKSAQGLIYRHACGQYYLMADSPYAALQVFTICGELTQAWSLDMPTVVPWRSGAAEALRRLGHQQKAEQLLREELALLDERYPRARGITLRHLGATVTDTEEGIRHFQAAVQLLSRVGDQQELAAARAGLAERGGRPHRGHQQSDQRPRVGTGKGAGTDPGHEKLSGAEHRVAVLAAGGHTNREIAELLSITPSTVEQHLTRVFRKLLVKRRDDLPQKLGTVDRQQAILDRIDLSA